MTIELTIKEAKILCHVLSNSTPAKEEEMISFMLYARIKRNIEEETQKNEPS